VFELEDQDDSMRRRATSAVSGLRRRLTPRSSHKPTVPFFLNLLPDAELWPTTGRIGEQRLKLVQYWRQMQLDMAPDTSDRCDLGDVETESTSIVERHEAVVPAAFIPAAERTESPFGSATPVHAAYRLEDFDDDLDDAPGEPEPAAPAALDQDVPAAGSQPMTWVPASVLFAKAPVEAEQPTSETPPLVASEPSSLIADEPPPLVMDAAPPLVNGAQPAVMNDAPPLVMNDKAPLIASEPEADVAEEPTGFLLGIHRGPSVAHSLEPAAASVVIAETPADAAEAAAAPVELLAATPVQADEALADQPEAASFDAMAAEVADAFAAESVEAFATGLASAELPAPDVGALPDDVIVAPMPDAIAESVPAEIGVEAVADTFDDLAADLLADAFSDEAAAHFRPAGTATDEHLFADSVVDLRLEDLEVASGDEMAAREPVEVEMPALAAAAAVLPDVVSDAIVEPAAADRVQPEHLPVEMPALIAEAAEAAEPVWDAGPIAERSADADQAAEFVEAEPMVAPDAVVAPAAFTTPVESDAPADELPDDSWAASEMPVPAAATAFATPIASDAPADEPHHDAWVETEMPELAAEAAFATPVTDDRAARDDRDEAADAGYPSDMLPAASAPFAVPLTADAADDREPVELADEPLHVELPVPAAPAAFAAPLLAQAADETDDDAPVAAEPREPLIGNRTFAELMAAGFAALRQSQSPAEPPRATSEPDQMPSHEADPTWDAAVAEWTVTARDQRLRRAGVIPMPAAKPTPAVKTPARSRAPKRSPVPALERFLRSAEARRRQVARESVA
jgi:hypothetical protein